MGPFPAVATLGSSRGQGQECPPLVGACLELGRGMNQRHHLFHPTLLHQHSFAVHYHVLHPALTLSRPHIYMYSPYWRPPSGGGGGGQRPAPTCRPAGRPPRPVQSLFVLEQPQPALARLCAGRCRRGLQPGSLASPRGPLLHPEPTRNQITEHRETPGTRELGTGQSAGQGPHTKTPLPLNLANKQQATSKRSANAICTWHTQRTKFKIAPSCIQ